MVIRVGWSTQHDVVGKQTKPSSLWLLCNWVEFHCDGVSWSNWLLLLLTKALFKQSLIESRRSYGAIIQDFLAVGSSSQLQPCIKDPLANSLLLFSSHRGAATIQLLIPDSSLVVDTIPASRIVQRRSQHCIFVQLLSIEFGD